MEGTLAATPADERPLESVKQHRKAVRRQIYGPMLLVIIVLLAVMLATLLPLKWSQIGIVSNVLVMCMALCPMVLCLFLVYVALVFAVVGMGKTHGASSRQLRRVQQMTRKMSARMASLGERLGKMSIGFSARLAFLDRLFSIFDRPGAQNDKPDRKGKTDDE